MDATRLIFDGKLTPWVSVSLQRTGQCNSHAGIFYRNRQRLIAHLHFAWHKSLKNDMAWGNVIGCVPPLDEADAKWLSGFCRRIAKTAPRRNIPYNLKHDSSVCFNRQTGSISFGPDSTGLGCATFVLAVFRSARLPLIDFDSGWPPPTDADRKARRVILAELARDQHADTRNQAPKIADEINLPRIRPDHVAGACLEISMTGAGVMYAACEANGSEVTRRMDAHFLATRP